MLNLLIKMLEAAFVDKMDIYRHVNVVTDDGATRSELSEDPAFSDIRCRISFNSTESPSDSAVDHVPVKMSPKLFYSNSIELSAGDYIVVHRYTSEGVKIGEYRGQVGLPSIYPTHCEAAFAVKEYA